MEPMAELWFGADLHTFLVEQGLPHDLTDDNPRWNDFVRQYGGVIHDGSLVYAGSGLQLISQVTFTTLPPSSDTMPFNTKWEIHTRDGQTLSLMLHPNWKWLGAF
jgi:hypothetical protein